MEERSHRSDTIETFTVLKGLTGLDPKGRLNQAAENRMRSNGIRFW